MKKTILVSIVLLLNVFAGENNTTKEIDNNSTQKDVKKMHDLTNEEISLFFIGFEEQARNELKAEEEAKRKQTELMKAKNNIQSSANPERTVMSHDGPGINVDDTKVSETVASHMQDNTPIPPLINLKKDFTLYGIACDGKVCQAFTSIGILKKNSKISKYEKVIEIKKNLLKTNKATIKI